uniref:TNase-like domain-containing protein n=1 Tax=Rhodosorus marinus TaxID=101924 RepID=A0A7S3E6B7_9RHOD|mmetsp:Transcript_12433/g.50847  ORF Transcript_12433/g.50847 Transcript_12433/m.50847 type:complete len:336 (+) Transcript_12433:107-1114(+)|eukprot:CAMPEP_0113966696 /NCGR_PEP_ID=MMETSP0011_2-20120614/8466_1 /TAXON_ID=101924 /ORGANISM="Rhodosorus marinus" /LENGTH=335 /DNA_ID=CAMNT_0000979393 /DNA_START=67 /DNA_END=1074 /DNA_ORIENTATION=+ /assembly_acc=CAM_ASM_000156
MALKDMRAVERLSTSPVSVEDQQYRKEFGRRKAKSMVVDNDVASILSALSEEDLRNSDDVYPKKRFEDRTRQTSRRMSVRDFSNSVDIQAAVAPKVQGYVAGECETYCGEEGAFLDEEEDEVSSRKSLLDMLRIRKRNRYRPVTTVPPELFADYSTQAIHDCAKCVRVHNGNSILVEVIPNFLPREVFEANKAYLLASQQNATVSMKRCLQDMIEHHYYPTSNGCAARLITVRLRGLLTPRPDEKHHQEVTTFLKALVENQKVHVHVYFKDRFNRAVADVVLEDDTSVSHTMLRAGMAWYTARYDRGYDLLEIEREARRAKIGIWAQRGPFKLWP